MPKTMAKRILFVVQQTMADVEQESEVLKVVKNSKKQQR